MNNRLVRFGRWVESRREAAALSPPVGYGDVLRYLFWKGMPGLAGPVVAIAMQPVLYGTEGLVVFGGAAALYLAAVLAGGAVARRRPLDAGVFALVGGAATAGMLRWTAAADAGLVAGFALFFGFTGFIVAGVGYVEVERALRD
jgi:hypothetical protein